MESRKRADPPHCINGCDFNKPIKNCNLCSKCFKENRDIEMAVKEALPPPSSSSSSSINVSLEKPESSTPRFSIFSFTGNTNNSNNGKANTIFGSNCNSNSSSSGEKKFNFSRDYNGNAASSGSIFKFATNSRMPEITARNFTFGTSTTTNKRCCCCKNRIGLIGFVCRCEDLFCGKHRHPEEHNCRFDYKALGRQLLRVQNPGLIADKLHTRI